MSMPASIAFRFRSSGFASFRLNQAFDVKFVRGVTDLVTTASLTAFADGRSIETVQIVFTSNMCCLFGNA